MDTPQRYAHPHSRHQWLSFSQRFHLGRRWRHRYRRWPCQPSQPGLQADSELRVTPFRSWGVSMTPAIALVALLTFACAGSPAEPSGPSAVADSCVVARPDFGAAATAADRSLFAYDVNAPLNLQKAVKFTNNGVEVSAISFSSPDGGSVTG